MVTIAARNIVSLLLMLGLVGVAWAGFEESSGGWMVPMPWPIVGGPSGWHFGGGAGGGFGAGGFEGGHGDNGDGGADFMDIGAQEDEMALSAVGLARLLGGGASHAHHIMSGGHKYTISGPTQQINTIHKVQLRHEGGDLLHRTPHMQQAQKKIIFVKAEEHPPQAHGWH